MSRNKSMTVKGKERRISLGVRQRAWNHPLVFPVPTVTGVWLLFKYFMYNEW